MSGILPYAIEVIVIFAALAALQHFKKVTPLDMVTPRNWLKWGKSLVQWVAKTVFHFVLVIIRNNRWNRITLGDVIVVRRNVAAFVDSKDLIQIELPPGEYKVVDRVWVDIDGDVLTTNNLQCIKVHVPVAKADVVIPLIHQPFRWSLKDRPPQVKVVK